MLGSAARLPMVIVTPENILETDDLRVQRSSPWTFFSLSADKISARYKSSRVDGFSSHFINFARIDNGGIR